MNIENGDKMMNPAQELIIDWYLHTCPLMSRDISRFMEALKKGCTLSQSDAVELRDKYLQMATVRAKETEYERVIGLLASISREYERVSREEIAVSGLLEIERIVSSCQPVGLGRRIAQSKIQSILSDLAKAGFDVT